ncbi:MAG: single-stranded DNA-binding protein [Clostridia bacterium]|nr:single-stranded DNA-binding protein [Clostridia bacterium]
METNFLENNSVTLVGKVANEKEFSHEIYGEKFYSFKLSVPRLSGNADEIPVTISERLFKEDELVVENKMKIHGQFRSYNSYEGEKNKLILTVFAKDVEFLDPEIEIVASKDFISNEIVLIGYICKEPIYRQTPFGREITDMLLAVNRAYNKSDYIPCICWGRNARFCSKMEVGTEVKIVGRIQSRMYEKKYDDGTVEQKVAYEVSIANLELIEEDDENIDTVDTIDNAESVEVVEGDSDVLTENSDE